MTDARRVGFWKKVMKVVFFCNKKHWLGAHTFNDCLRIYVSTCSIVYVSLFYSLIVMQYDATYWTICLDPGGQ